MSIPNWIQVASYKGGKYLDLGILYALWIFKYEQLFLDRPLLPVSSWVHANLSLFF